MKNKNKVVSYIVTAIVGIGIGSVSTIAIERLPDKNTSKYQVSSLFYRQTTPKETPILKSLVEKTDWKINKNDVDYTWGGKSVGTGKEVTVEGIFHNDTDVNVKYIDFEFKLKNKDGSVYKIESAYEKNIAPGEKRLVRISLLGDDAEKLSDFEVVATSKSFKNKPYDK